MKVKVWEQHGGSLFYVISGDCRYGGVECSGRSQLADFERLEGVSRETCRFLRGVGILYVS